MIDKALIDRALIDRAAARLNWDLILQTVNQKGILHTKEKLFNKLTDTICFMMQNNMTESASEYWLIKWKPEKNKEALNTTGTLVIYFLYDYAKTVFVANKEAERIPEDLSQVEFKMLHQMLQKAISVENYELCAVIKQQMMKVIGEKKE